MIKPFNKTAARNDWAAASDRDAAVEEIEALYAQANQITRRRAEAKMPRFETRMTWDGSGNGHWDVVLSGMVDGRMRLLATIPLDEWISLGPTQYMLELHAEGEEVLKPTARPGPR